jgi:hypothetical protein
MTSSIVTPPSNDHPVTGLGGMGDVGSDRPRSHPSHLQGGGGGGGGGSMNHFQMDQSSMERTQMERTVDANFGMNNMATTMMRNGMPPQIAAALANPALQQANPEMWNTVAKSDGGDQNQHMSSQNNDNDAKLKMMWSQWSSGPGNQ